MAETKSQSTRGQMIGEKPAEFVTLYDSNGDPHKCSPVDAREILAGGYGYTSEPPQRKVNEQQPKQQPESGNSVAGPETATSKSDNQGTDQSGNKTTQTANRQSGKK
jgi:hypothetical protein